MGVLCGESAYNTEHVLFSDPRMLIETAFRFPDFLHHLQSHHGAPKILCEVVVEKITANSTTQMYVLYNDLMSFHDLMT